MSLQKKVKVRVHVAQFLGENTSKVPHLFINVCNNYKRRHIQINRIYFLNHFEIDGSGGLRIAREVQNIERPLPFNLAPRKEWETWLIAPKEVVNSVYKNFLIETQEGTILVSKTRKGVSPSGIVPGNK